MTALKDIADKVRSKNAGPFWLTLDVFCGTEEAFARISAGLDTDLVAETFKTDPATLKRFDMQELNVVKFSLPRPAVQGTRADRDMHGASFAVLLGEVQVD
ncbi:protein of unknown function [Aliiroseovarius sediminilitoris]|uniref:DUF4387 domain-containing protein n=1 Tax=Aliiroseovarius sediminilitoris TaxID=1173584 RepID=A0A1I0N104_9RHOB|nr:DUF4387 family protein [Aliiroseovarius sediminilitoris]SEV94702.1 protein of unknown function [Aliiroseovarius sediminilitoris]